MRLAHRRAHRGMWWLLSVLLPALLLLGLATRRDGPVEAAEVQVADARAAMAPLAAAFHGEPTDGLKMVGVTGTNGKTTTAFLVRSLLEAAGTRCGMLGTVQQVVGGRQVHAGLGRRPSTLPAIAGNAAGDDVFPVFSAALGDRHYMIEG